jgi:hypothetical protein
VCVAESNGRCVTLLVEVECLIFTMEIFRLHYTVYTVVVSMEAASIFFHTSLQNESIRLPSEIPLQTHLIFIKKFQVKVF